MNTSKSSFVACSRNTFYLCCLLSSLISWPVRPICGQQSSPGKTKTNESAEQKPADAERRINVFALKYTNASRLREIVEPLLLQIDKSATVVDDSQNNRLVVRADANAMQALESTLKVLDTPSYGIKDQQISTRFVRLRTSPTIEMQEAMRLFLSKSGRISMVPAHNLMVVQDTSESLKNFGEALNEYDVLLRESEKGENAAQADATIRIVWLINGVPNLSAPPDDLKGVITDLAKLGVADLRLAAQSIVKTTNGYRFQIRSSPEVGNPCEFDVGGELITMGAFNNLTIRLTAEETSAPANEGNKAQAPKLNRLCNLEATVRIPQGQTVVLGVAPTEKKTSVFVVHISTGDK